MLKEYDRSLDYEKHKYLQRKEQFKMDEFNKIYTMTLSDGTVLSDLRMNGNNFISKTEVTKSTFSGKLARVIIDDGETTTEMINAALVQIATYDWAEGWYFVLRELTPDEIYQAKLRGDVDYLAMMADVEL